MLRGVEKIGATRYVSGIGKTHNVSQTTTNKNTAAETRRLPPAARPPHHELSCASPIHQLMFTSAHCPPLQVSHRQ